MVNYKFSKKMPLKIVIGNFFLINIQLILYYLSIFLIFFFNDISLREIYVLGFRYIRESKFRIVI